MTGLELIAVVLVAVLLMTWLARRLHLSEPLMLLGGGVLIGLTPHFDRVDLPPDAVLLVFLPALLYWEALTTSLREIKTNFRSIVLQSTGLVLVTALAVAAVAHALGYAWPIAFVLGAVLAPTDVAAVAAVVTAMPRRIVTLLRTESLLNDGTALVLLAVSLELLTTGEPFSWAGTTLRFVESYAGGAVIGAAIALALIPVRRHLKDRSLHSGLSVATPFVAFLPAEALHVSGVLAVVTCALVTSRVGPGLIRSDARLEATAFWEVTAFLLNGALFVLVGIQTPAAVRALASISLLQATMIAAAVSATVIAARVAWFYTVPYLIRLVDRRRQQRQRRIGARQRLPLAWAGMRGAISSPQHCRSPRQRPMANPWRSATRSSSSPWWSSPSPSPYSVRPSRQSCAARDSPKTPTRQRRRHSPYVNWPTPRWQSCRPWPTGSPCPRRSRPTSRKTCANRPHPLRTEPTTKYFAASVRSAPHMRSRPRSSASSVPH